jgi:hypothetical protein
VETIYDCKAWYLLQYDQWGNLISETFLYYSDCVPELDGNTDSGDSPSGSVPPPPPPCPPASGSAFVNNHSLTRFTQPLPGGGDDGGMPPPQTCPTQAVVPLPDTTGCGKAAALSALATNAIQAAQDASILNNTTATGIENGANENLTGWPGNSYINTPVTPGTASSWTPTPTWNSTNGYTIGFKHGHPGGDGPSPQDIATIVYQISLNNELKAAGSAAIQFYEANANVKAETSAGSYVVTVSDWTSIQNILINQFGTAADQATFNDSYAKIANNYLATPAATLGDATAYALTQLFGNTITIYFAPAGSTTYTPLTIVTDAGGNQTISLLQCP